MIQLINCDFTCFQLWDRLMSTPEGVTDFLMDYFTSSMRLQVVDKDF